MEDRTLLVKTHTRAGLNARTTCHMASNLCSSSTDT
uniref:Uncharacterized protein n=1 Tax=Arundo donax TaxID=35708 RepID=A0A0A8YLS9_ARUDO